VTAKRAQALSLQTDLDQRTDFLLASHPEDVNVLIEFILDALSILRDIQKLADQIASRKENLSFP
jgi:hypothetical protein